MKKLGITREEHDAHEKAKAKNKTSNTESRKKYEKRKRDAEIIKKHFASSGKIIKRLLCVGARSEKEVTQLKAEFGEAVGIDILSPTANILKVDAHNLKSTFGKNEFHFAYASHCLEHMVDPEVVMEGIRHVSRLGCFITLPVFDVLYKSHCSMFDMCEFIHNLEYAKSEKIFDILKENNHLFDDFSYFGDFEVRHFDCETDVKEVDNKKIIKEFNLLLEWV